MYRLLLIVLLLAFLTTSCATVSGGSKSAVKSSFTVYGSCNMCKTTIEASIADFPGVVWSDWDIESKEITVKHYPLEVDINELKKRIARAGYDSETHRAEDDVYDSLPGCCKYDRP